MLVPQASRADPMAGMRSEGAEVAFTRVLPLPRSCNSHFSEVAHYGGWRCFGCSFAAVFSQDIASHSVRNGLFVY